MEIEIDLNFAKVLILKEDLAELIVNDGIEITLGMVNELHQTLLSNLTTPFYLLVNIVNQYCYEFKAQPELGSLKELKAIAFSYNTSQAKQSAEYLSKLKRENPWNIELYNNRESALNWLEQQKMYL